MLRYLLLLLFLLPISLKSNELRENFSILDSLVERVSVDISNQIPNEAKPLNLIISEHPASWLIKQHLINNISKKKIPLTDSASENNLNINISKISVEYKLMKADDKLNRLVTVDIDGYIKYKLITPIGKQKLVYSDTIATDDVGVVEASTYAFAKSIVPHPKESFFEKYFQPLIYVSSAVIVTVLFFTLRSK
ncbi:MAG: hypothetical protein WCR42_14130 [bacterium]